VTEGRQLLSSNRFEEDVEQIQEVDTFHWQPTVENGA
jgi:hypothetical protein